MAPSILPTSGESRPLPPAITALLEEATNEYAAQRGRTWLVAFPSHLRMNRCDDDWEGPPESSPKCGKIIDGVVYLPLRCINTLGRTSLSRNASVAFLIDSDGKEMTRLHDFAKRAGARLVANAPHWFSVSGHADPATLWAIALMFASPKARLEYPE